MAKTTALKLEHIAAIENIVWAMHRACRGKRKTADVKSLFESPDKALNRIREALCEGALPIGGFDSFTIHDPKQRIIHAAPLLDRIAHHALMRCAGPRLELALLPSVYACRVGKGVHAAVLQAQKHARRFRWVMHTDIAHYFPCIDHQILHRQLFRRFRGDGCLLIQSVIDSHGMDSGKGLPIGALTSQHFANHYLSDFDRWCIAQPGIEAHCRYMDDQLLWSNNRQVLCDLQYALKERLERTLALTMKPALIQRTSVGITFCGIRIKPFQLRASPRRRQRFRLALDRLETQWKLGEIDSAALQTGYDAIHSILLPADERSYRGRVLAQRELLDA